MSRYKEVNMYLQGPGVTATVTADVTQIDLTGIGVGDTFTLTPTRVDTATAGAATGAIAYSAVEATQAANAQTAIRALGGIYADATVAAAGGVLHDITVNGGYNVTWVMTPTGFAGGATVETTAGKVVYSKAMPFPGGQKYGIVKRIILQDFVDDAVDISVTDESPTALNVFVKTDIDTHNAGATVKYDKMLTADGVAGEDGAAAAAVGSGIFAGPLNVTVETQSPVSAYSGAEPVLKLIVDTGKGGGFKKRSTGAFTGTTAHVHMPTPWVKVKRIRYISSADATVTFTSVVDAEGHTIYAKAGDANYTTAVNVQLSKEGVDQAANAVADLLDVVAKSPLTCTIANMASGTFTVEFFVET